MNTTSQREDIVPDDKHETSSVLDYDPLSAEAKRDPERFWELFRNSS